MRWKRADIREMPTEELERPGAPYELRLVDDRGVAWLVTRAVRLRDLLSRLEADDVRVPDGWRVLIDGLEVARGRRPTIGDYLAALHRQRERG